MESTKETDREIIKDLCSVIEDEQKREEKLFEIIKELMEENARLKRRLKIFSRL